MLSKVKAAMNMPMSDGRVTLNVAGQRYRASFRVELGTITVTSGSVSTILEVGEVVSPTSIARTILRIMVRERPAATLSESNEKDASTG